MSDDVMVNKNAPVLAVGDIDIVAPPDIVWAVITDFEHWPRWNPDVKAVELRGAVREGRSSGGNPAQGPSPRPSDVSSGPVLSRGVGRPWG